MGPGDRPGHDRRRRRCARCGRRAGGALRGVPRPPPERPGAVPRTRPDPVVASVNTSVARYALGAVIGGLAIAAVAIRRRTLPEWTGPSARLSEVVIGLALLIAILEVLGTLGLFELGPIVIACVLVGLAWVRELAGTH